MDEPEDRGSAPTALSPEYLRRIERLEALPEMQSGTDKTWVHDAIREWREYFAKVVRVGDAR